MNKHRSSENGFFNIFTLLILVIVLVAGAYFFLSPKNNITQNELPVILENTKVTYDAPALEPDIPEEQAADDYENFVDTTTGFLLKYSNKYRVKEDSAWINANLILYSGGQSYDLVVQTWTSEIEFKKFFAETPDSNVTVHLINGKYVTLLNVNNDPEITKVIESFEPVEQP